MTDNGNVTAFAPFGPTPPELSYPGLSPQLLARVKQLWSAKGLDFDKSWRLAMHSFPGFEALPRLEQSSTSAAVDLVFLFDQCVIWARAVHAAAAAGRAHAVAGLTAAQWHGLAGVTARLVEQLGALRLLALNELPMSAMQIARSVSEDADMALVLLIRPRLAERFAQCRTVEDASDFWRRHIAGGRAFRTVAQRLYSVGIDHSDDTEYARWRRSVLAVLGASVHSNALQAGLPARRDRQVLVNDDSLHFATYRIHELCSFAQLVKPELTDILRAAGSAAPAQKVNPFAPLAAPLNSIIVSQIQSLNAPAQPSGGSGAAKPH